LRALMPARPVEAPMTFKDTSKLEVLCAQQQFAPFEHIISSRVSFSRCSAKRPTELEFVKFWLCL
jgi:hypothetical protein